MNFKIWVYGLALYAVAGCAKVPKKSWISFSPHIYIGVGAVDILKENPPDFKVTHDKDKTYLAINPLESEGFFLQSQFRVNLIKAGWFSLGYAFWGHQHEYSNDYPREWFREGIKYPHRYNLSFHAACIQMDCPRGLWENRVIPFFLGGIGSFYGSSKVASYGVDEYTGLIVMFEEKNMKYDGLGWMAGAGTIVFRYAYFYTGLTCFSENDVPARMFLNVIVGVKI
ncbi:hypothetical protein JW835_00105 [bacterium]|nr:hypothetical protein [bacterium]